MSTLIRIPFTYTRYEIPISRALAEQNCQLSNFNVWKNRKFIRPFRQSVRFSFVRSKWQQPRVKISTL